MLMSLCQFNKFGILLVFLQKPLTVLEIRITVMRYELGPACNSMGTGHSPGELTGRHNALHPTVRQFHVHDYVDPVLPHPQ
jgi:hypothetical protein